MANVPPNQPPQGPQGQGSGAPGPGALKPMAPQKPASMSRFKRELRREIRRKGGEVEVNFLNITAMLDMMTIILVFLLKSYNSSAMSVSISNDLLPPSSSTTLDPAETATVTITKSEITVGEKPAVELTNWTVPAGATNPRAPLVITPVMDLLKKEVDRQKFIGKWNKSAQFEGLLSVIGDRQTPYSVLFSVLATAGQAELSNYKFVVLKQEN